MNARTLKETPLFSSLSEADLGQIAERLKPQALAQGGRLFDIGDEANALYIVRSGWVRLTSAGGEVLASLGPGSVIGEADMLRGHPRSSGAIAATSVELWTLTSDDLTDLIMRRPAIGITLSRNAGTHIVQVEAYLTARLRQVPGLGEADLDALAEMARRLEPMEVSRGQTLFRAGDPPRALFMVESGQVTLLPGDPQGEPYPLRAGQIFGELALLTGKPHFYGAQAAEDALLWVLERDAFRTLIHRHPGLARALSRGLRAPLSPEDQAAAAAVLARMPLFEGLADDVLASISSRLLLLYVPAGEIIFAEGARADAMYLVDSGEVELLQEAGRRREVLARIGPGGFFGEMALLTGRPRAATATATRDAILWVLYRNEFEDLVTRHPAIATSISRGLSERLAEAGGAHIERHLRHISLLQGLPGEALREISERLHPMRYRANEVIYHQGDPASYLYLIESGRVSLFAEQGGVEVPVAILNSGDFLGESAVLTGERSPHTAQALTDVDLWLLRPGDFEALSMRYPALALNLSRCLEARLRQSAAQAIQSVQSAISAQGVGAATSAPAATVTSPATPARVEPAPARFRPIPQRARPATSAHVRPATERTGSLGFDSLASWYHSLSVGAKIRLAVVLLLLAWLLGIAAPSALLDAVSLATMLSNFSGADALPPGPVGEGGDKAGVLAMAMLPEQQLGPTATYTPLPTDTPVPTDTPLPSPTPTDTPVPPTPTPTNTPIPPTPTPRPIQPQPTPTPEPRAVAASIVWDSRLDQLGVGLRPADVAPGQLYWRLVEARWADEQQSEGRHHIFVNVLDESGKRIIGQPIKVSWREGSVTGVTEDKPATEYSYNFQMYAAGNSYDLSVEGLPSDTVTGMGLGDIERRAWKIHTSFYLTFQRSRR